VKYRLLSNIIQTAVSMGYQQGYARAAQSYCKSFCDEIKAKDVKMWCAANGVSFAVFNSLVEEGRVKPFRKSSAENAAIYYKISEMNKALSEADIQMYAAELCDEIPIV